MKTALQYWDKIKTPKQAEMVGLSLLCHQEGGQIKFIQKLRIQFPDMTAKQIYDFKKKLARAVDKYPFNKATKTKP